MLSKGQNQPSNSEANLQEDFDDDIAF